jgi:hypothetical protein
MRMLLEGVLGFLGENCRIPTPTVKGPYVYTFEMHERKKKKK